MNFSHKEEGRRKKEEGRRKKEEKRRKREGVHLSLAFGKYVCRGEA
ncbi:MAG: hypothetical protein JGK24_08165 [Microcoleus sp. PH2017_29_MFU_D_A]|nr:MULTISPECIES: hypothetical protein [unclassified Microcoleus]MCC3429784.1 hypothetical protein [Microcoleus sp. PH2017_04_SCI_O_A]MCC3442128.1 hypothetical protein [Microcoleus sp. PH2017_03_ELD_O_A]MCC3466864.1 hypothetical protein [Microcoleus sp. PH2017_06_SFM_O_A]MCC3501607.1 hypothetical protein [Microcoleus sp. PH2017_19_SFW_U_A]MCC3507692.1 hypothetical protein [Microcoleus sp. PH2017_17_BER_D_A]